jgi:aerobic-type carbon monoxide dehydrogenase small subunit (CoxS/CutS family)
MSKLTLGKLVLETARGRVSGSLPAPNAQELRQSLADRFCECGALMVIVDGKRQCAQKRARALARRAALESRERS